MPKKNKYIKINLIIDAAGDKILFKIIDNSKNYTNEYENCRKNFDMFSLLLFKFFKKNRIKLENIKNVYVNIGPGNFSGIRTSLSTLKAFKIIYNFNIYGFSSKDIENLNYYKVFDLQRRGKLIKNLIKPLYLG
tara:strand:+ start:6168 stop:6569 length:402 start_codon:yes stop_codon:yes gene_type:complete